MASKDSSRKQRVWLLISLVLSIGLLIVWVVFLLKRMMSSSSETTSSRKKQKQQTNDIPGTNIYSVYQIALLLTNDTNVAQYFAAIAAHETGNFTSDVYRENHNLFGMRLPKQRDTTAIGENRGYAVYNEDSDSIKDLLLWFAYSNTDPGKFDSPDAIVKFMKEKGYFEASEKTYATAVKKWYNVLLDEL